MQLILHKSLIANETPKYAIRTIEMIPNNAPILSAIEARDMSAATELLSKRAVSPFALTVSGVNLLEKLASEMFEILFGLLVKGRTEGELETTRKEGRWKICVPDISKTIPLYSPEEVRIQEHQFADMKNLFLQLISQGVDPAHRSMEGR
jgi:hypothetical protein